MIHQSIIEKFNAMTGYLISQCYALITAWLTSFYPKPAIPHAYGRRKPFANQSGHTYRNPPKPHWVKSEIIRMKALMPEQSCRKLADNFNRRFKHSRNMTMSKTYVAELIRQYLYEICIVQNKIKQKPPKHIPIQKIWGMDLTGKTDTQGELHQLLGILEHASRANLLLTVLKDKTTITMLECLIHVIRQYGKPTYIRTDNEPVFHSRVFQVGLWLLGIKHQTTAPGCPWMNGRIERFFGTLKAKLNRWEVDTKDHLETSLKLFRVWYNQVRPHQHLDGRTPAEVWNGVDCYATAPRQDDYFEAWDGLLTGYYLRY
jgi:transposase InsO family protein